jgi:hypothetical protein
MRDKEMDTMDLWDDAGPFLYRHMPESGLAAFFTEERDMLQINQESDGYWLSDSANQGADRYDTLAEAKASGDEQIATAQAGLDARLLAEAGLPAESWTVSYQDGLRFEQKDGPLWITANERIESTRQSWDLLSGDVTLLADAPDIAAVVAAMPSDA